MSKKLTIEEMKLLANNRGGKCLSSNYVNINSKLKWQCEKEHIWEATPASVAKSCRWCPECANDSRKLSIGEMKLLAKKHAGECLSVKYINSYTKLRWQCEYDHEWEARPGSIKQGQWCPQCASDKTKVTIEDMREIAKERKGNCLSKIYQDAHSKLKWECSEGHVWESKPNAVKNGRWCAKCAGKEKLTIEEMYQIAQERGGLCLFTICIVNGDRDNYFQKSVV
jgi:hypothetical protein